MHWPKKRVLLITLASVGIFFLVRSPVEVAQAQSPCGPGQIDMLDYMLPDDTSSGNAMSNGECFYTYEEGGSFYVVKSCNNPIYFEQYTYDDAGIYLIADTTWTDRCPDGSIASGIYTGWGDEPGFLRYPRCVTVEPGGTAQVPAHGRVEGLSQTTCEPCRTAHSGPISQSNTLTYNTDGTVSVTVYEETYHYSDENGWMGFEGPTGDNTVIGTSDPMEANTALLDCTAPPIPPGGPQTCFLDLPEPKDCCPLVSTAGPSWLRTFVVRVGGSILGFVEWILERFGLANIQFTLYSTTPDLARSTQLPADADYFWASPSERYDPRRISLPDERPDAGNWAGIAGRMAPPRFRPPAMWGSVRDERLKWVIPLYAKYGVDDWTGDDGDYGGIPSAFHPLQFAANDVWNWTIRTSATDEIVATARANSTPLASTEEGANAEETDNFNSKETGNPSQASGSFDATPPQTLGLQSVNSVPGGNEGVVAQANGEEPCAFINVSCTAANWQAICFVQGQCAQDSPCGHIHIESVPKVYPTNADCFQGGGLCLAGAAGSCPNKGAAYYTIAEGSSSWGITFETFGDIRDQCSASTTCTIELDENGNGACAAAAGEPCGEWMPPEAADVCHPYYPEIPEGVCSDLGARTLDAARFIALMFDEYLSGGVPLVPFFPHLERIGYLFAGILTEHEVFRPLREGEVGGVFDAFLPPSPIPPDQQKFPTLDANADFGPHLEIDIVWREPGGPCPPFYREVCRYACNGTDMGCCTPDDKSTCCAPCQNLPCDYQCCKEGAGCWDVGSCADCLLEETCQRDCPTCEAVDCKCCFAGAGPIPAVPCPDGPPGCIPNGYHPPPIPLNTEKGVDLIDLVGSQTWALENIQYWLSPPL